jgi:cytochrome c3-like protein
MARRPTFGTPERLRSYLDPDREEARRHPERVSTLRMRSLLNWGAVVLGAVAIAVTVASRRASQPGELSSGHARFERSCQTCHGPLQKVPALFTRTKGQLDALDARCADCHDRFRKNLGHTVDAHMRFYEAKSPLAAGWAGRFQCTDCHTEHNGRTADITRAPELRCAACHGVLEPRVTRFDTDHPEFRVLLEQARANPDLAALRAADEAPLESDLNKVISAPIPPFQERRPPDPGIRFNHARHLDEYMAKHPRYKDDRGDQRCSRCHALERSGQDLEPSTFEGSCGASGCHGTEEGLLKAETTEPVPIDLRRLSPDPEVAQKALEGGEEGAVVPLLPRLKTLDAAGLAPAWLAGVRSDFQEPEDVVEAQGTFVKRIRHRDPWILFAVDMLAREADELGRSRGPLRASALRARQTEERAAAFLDPCSEAGSASIPNTGLKQELCASIHALDEEIAGLDKRLQPEAAPAPTPGASPADAGRQSLESLSNWLGTVPLGEPHQGRLALLRQRLGEALGAGRLSTAPAVDPRREDRARDELRRQLDILAGMPSEWVQHEVHTLQYKLDQLDEPQPVSGPDSAADPARDLAAQRQNLDAQRRELRSSVERLSGLGKDCGEQFLRLALAVAPAVEPPPLPEEQRDAWTAREIELRERALLFIAKPCLECHKLGRTATGHIEWAPLRDQERQLADSRFVHQPHLSFQAADFPDADARGGSCGSCHASILHSNQSGPIHFTGIESCRTCHNSGDVSQRCETCHDFHPPLKALKNTINGFKLCDSAMH